MRLKTKYYSLVPNSGWGWGVNKKGEWKKAWRDKTQNITIKGVASGVCVLPKGKENFKR